MLGWPQRMRYHCLFSRMKMQLLAFYWLLHASVDLFLFHL